MLADFGPDAVQAWAEALGQPLFTGSTRRVFPVGMKASPLLRAWLARLEAAGVTLRRRWRWVGWDGDALAFETAEGPRAIAPRVCVLALGGASWPRLGSDAAWTGWLAARGVALTPFVASNAGLRVAWSAPMARQFGQPVKGIALTAGGAVSRGEMVVTAEGLEGGGIYAVNRGIRAGEPLTLDLMPDVSAVEVAQRLSRPRGKASRSTHLRKVLKLDPVKLALLMEFARPLPEGDALAAVVKRLTVAHQGLMPLDGAISSAGGIAADALDAGLMLRAVPGIFAAGEMLDWDAPTGGYLLTACMATGRHAGRAAAAYAASV